MPKNDPKGEFRHQRAWNEMKTKNYIIKKNTYKLYNHKISLDKKKTKYINFTLEIQRQYNHKYKNIIK